MGTSANELHILGMEVLLSFDSFRDDRQIPVLGSLSWRGAGTTVDSGAVVGTASNELHILDMEVLLCFNSF